MNSPRRDLLKFLSLNGLFASVPSAFLALFPKFVFAKIEPGVVTHVFVHFREGTSVALANTELGQWTKCIGYTDTLEAFKRDGRLFSYRISREQNPFIVELHLKSMSARQELIQAFQAQDIFNESKRHDLGYTISETLYTTSNGQVSEPQHVRQRT